MKKFLIVCLCLVNCLASKAQEPSSTNNYDDFKTYRHADGDKLEKIEKMQALLANSDQLTIKQVTNIQYHLGRVFEELELPDSATIYYKKSLVGEPNYEVIHRALGFIYLTKAQLLLARTDSSAQAADEKIEALKNYHEIVLLALPHLEKYQACDPDDDTLAIIKSLYKSIKSKESDETIAARIKTLGMNCVTLLDDD